MQVPASVGHLAGAWLGHLRGGRHSRTPPGDRVHRRTHRQGRGAPAQRETTRLSLLAGKETGARWGYWWQRRRIHQSFVRPKSGGAGAGRTHLAGQPSPHRERRGTLLRLPAHWSGSDEVPLQGAELPRVHELTRPRRWSSLNFRKRLQPGRTGNRLLSTRARLRKSASLRLFHNSRSPAGHKGIAHQPAVFGMGSSEAPSAANTLGLSGRTGVATDRGGVRRPVECGPAGGRTRKGRKRIHRSGHRLGQAWRSLPGWRPVGNETGSDTFVGGRILYPGWRSASAERLGRRSSLPPVVGPESTAACAARFLRQRAFGQRIYVSPRNQLVLVRMGDSTGGLDWTGPLAAVADAMAR